MAGIDKLRTSNYVDYSEFRLWCIKNKPELLSSFYEPFLSYLEWEQLQQNIRNKHPFAEEDGLVYYDDRLVIALFLSNEDKYLYWHCPLDFVREYLETQCGYKKANWFVKLFWRY
jgi:hypothetical protein